MVLTLLLRAIFGHSESGQPSAPVKGPFIDLILSNDVGVIATADGRHFVSKTGDRGVDCGILTTVDEKRVSANETHGL